MKGESLTHWQAMKGESLTHWQAMKGESLTHWQAMKGESLTHWQAVKGVIDSPEITGPETTTIHSHCWRSFCLHILLRNVLSIKTGI